MAPEQQFRSQQDRPPANTGGTASSTGVDPHTHAEPNHAADGPRARRSSFGPKFENGRKSGSGMDDEVAEERPTGAAMSDAHHQPEPQPQARPQRHYRPRTCRICLETVHPTFEMDTGAVSSTIFGAHPRVRYISEDTELGRLISPCVCKGSQRYVHEGCLQAWRRQAPLRDRNFFCCPTCGFRYRMDRLTWATWFQSKLTRGALTLLVVFVAIFLLGFVADPIINLWIDPVGVVIDAVSDVADDVEDLRRWHADDEPFTWSLHFLKGLFSLGLLGAIKAFLTMSPWQWWHLRNGGFLGTGGANRRANGRDRVEGINFLLVLIGLFTFLAAVWKLISTLSERTLEKVSDRVLDVQGDDDDEEEDEET